MKQYAVVMSCYSFDEKDRNTKELTWKKAYCLKTNQILANWSMSRFSFNYYLSEDDFINLFEKEINVEKYNLWLEWKILEIQLVWKPLWIVEKIPERKSN